MSSQAVTRACLAIIAMLAGCPAFADELSDCRAAAGSYITGTVVSEPSFKPGKRQKSVELSHTHVSVMADQDGRVYDVAMDNVFAAGYDAAVSVRVLDTPTGPTIILAALTLLILLSLFKRR